MIDTLPVHHLSRAAAILKAGDVLCFPTGTSYGLGANALSEPALAKLTALKGRDPEKSYSVILPEKNPGDFAEFTDAEKKALAAFACQPLTLLVKAKPPLKLIAKDGRAGIRTADHPFTKELAKALDFPFTATSANASGGAPAYSVDDLYRIFPRADFKAIDGGATQEKKASTVAAFVDGEWKVYREGAITERMLRKAASA